MKRKRIRIAKEEEVLAAKTKKTITKVWVGDNHNDLKESKGS